MTGLEILIKKGEDVNQLNKQGENVLMLLCRCSTSDKIVQLAQLLVQQKDFNINHKSSGKGNDALINLCRYSNSDKMVEVAQLLIKNRIDVNHENNKKRKAVDYLNKRHNVSRSNKNATLQLLRQQ